MSHYFWHLKTATVQTNIPLHVNNTDWNTVQEVHATDLLVHSAKAIKDYRKATRTISHQSLHIEHRDNSLYSTETQDMSHWHVRSYQQWQIMQS
jgi:hypothetical protein